MLVRRRLRKINAHRVRNTRPEATYYAAHGVTQHWPPVDGINYNWVTVADNGPIYTDHAATYETNPLTEGYSQLATKNAHRYAEGLGSIYFVLDAQRTMFIGWPEGETVPTWITDNATIGSKMPTDSSGVSPELEIRLYGWDVAVGPGPVVLGGAEGAAFNLTVYLL